MLKIVKYLITRSTEPLPKLPDKIQNHSWKDVSPLISKMVLKTILHGQMTEKIVFEVRPKKGKKITKSAFKKVS